MNQPSHPWVTVFGGTGFLGRRIVETLLKGNWPVRIASRHPKRPEGVNATPEQMETIQADIHDEASIKRAIEGAHAVVNAVSLYIEKGGNSTFEAVHVLGAERLARLCREAKVNRLVHISGLGIDTESDSAYVRARAQGDQAVREQFPNATILRPAVMFGPNDSLLGAIDSATLMPVVPLFGRGDTLLQPVFVGDVAAAVHSVLAQEDTQGEIYELGGAEVYPYKELVKQVAQHRHRKRLEFPVPFPLWRALAQLTALLPNPPLTRDQVILMEKDNRVGENTLNFHDLGIHPRSVSELLDQCLKPS